MLKFIVKAETLLRCRRGATAIEYGLIAAGISIAIVTILTTVGTDLNSMFTTVANALHKK